MMQAFLFLPILRQTEEILTPSDHGTETLLKKITKIYQIFSPFVSMETIWVYEKNHLTGEFLQSIELPTRAMDHKSLQEMISLESRDLWIVIDLEMLSILPSLPVPIILIHGITPDPVRKEQDLNWQMLRFQSPSRCDYILDLRGDLSALAKRESAALGINTQRVIPWTFDNELPDFLSGYLENPRCLPKETNLFHLFYEAQKKYTEKIRIDLIEQRENQLSWMQKAFMAEIDRLLVENEKLREENQKLTLKAELAPFDFAKNQDLEIKHQSLIRAHNELIEKYELQKKEKEILTTNLLEIDTMKNHIHDLENKLAKLNESWHQVILQWFTRSAKTWFFRLPAALFLWAFHILSLVLQKWKRN